ncbi:hypothetical protein [Photobacterium leiognathi]|uniref:hypothetical protein n=1 Tax=Photobacterium leiognathi TaxID=553611 RepID=UPI002981106B|nr:hypothetical protein [Photobacterium leiognathi]
MDTIQTTSDFQSLKQDSNAYIKRRNQREIGLQCQLIMNNGDYRQEDVAQILGTS